MKIFKLNLILLVFLAFPNFAQKPIMLDNIHYTVRDSASKKMATDFFKVFFNAKQISEETENPLTFMDILTLNSHETTINISFIDSSKIETEMKPQNFSPIYGVHWLAINTKSIRKSVKALLKRGYNFAAEDFTLPNEPDVNAVAMYGFDNNIIVLVERPHLKVKTSFSIDHIQLIVKNLENNVKFYQDVLGAEVVDKKDRSTVLKIGNQKIVLSEPEALGLVREQVLERDTTKFTSHIDYLGFLYDEVEPAFYAAKANNYTILSEPKALIFNEKLTPYTICTVLSPDNLEIDLIQEEGRTAGRTFVKVK
ncbi:glyoxalase/bleomycin resistance protein/dioxygenase superfamily protein [Arcicella aurantiaca]|uniref:Glyoxalase/bleomycin resistance protein/dioxygenase superfamily protein n=1 Tax=Arcicella aurantiaca TaxID=591202 RepID=A0A316E6B8_9BACT|nr:VOC family protein [Arcicella aurantiaca]PWK25178.1 glyoxalase/bleomycin resistance protein/dioxygenase superfamily protein [Arcicella aurantiaca]